MLRVAVEAQRESATTETRWYITCCGQTLTEAFDKGVMVCQECGSAYTMEEIEAVADRAKDTVDLMKNQLRSLA
jgi:hypothetical protein